MKLSHAALTFNSTGTPESKDYNDVYFSKEDGIAESEFVFLQGNQLWQQWLDWEQASFCIAETGFGTGLNFLLSAKLFSEFLQAKPSSPLKRLHYISLEKHPIKTEALAKIHQQWPSLGSFSESLLAKYPPALTGIHRSKHTAGKIPLCITLDLVLGDAHTGLSEIHNLPTGIVNAWYLDGFAPSKNDSMWDVGVFQQMARLSASSASLATFTAAGAVKRGLQGVGFEVVKIKGYGRKREMITATFKGSLPAGTESLPTIESQPPYFNRAISTSKQTEREGRTAQQSIAVVGGGVAGALLAFRLTSIGQKVTLICKDTGPAQGASGNPIAGVYPQLNADASVNSQFFVHAFLYARQFYDDLLSQGLGFDHDWCSVLQLGFNANTQERLQKMLDKDLWPDELAQVISPAQATKIANIDIPHPALHLPKAGWIAPLSLIQACLAQAASTGLLSTLYEHEMLSYEASDSVVSLALKTAHGKLIDFECSSLVIAAGADSESICQQHLPMRLTRGQVEAIRETITSAKLSAVICHKGYFTPSVNGRHALGSTYVKQDTATDYRHAESAKNIAMHKQAMGALQWMDEIETSAQQSKLGRAAIRCSTPDHLPLVGAMPNIDKQKFRLQDLYKALPPHRYPAADDIKNVYVLTGLGSRGITSAPILVDVLIAQMTQTTFPLSTTLLNALMPNRFLVRSLIRQQEYE